MFIALSGVTGKEEIGYSRTVTKLCKWLGVAPFD